MPQAGGAHLASFHVLADSFTEGSWSLQWKICPSKSLLRGQVRLHHYIHLREQSYAKSGKGLGCRKPFPNQVTEFSAELNLPTSSASTVQKWTHHAPPRNM
eukprot:scaffold63624_cov19-Tisochrysis_lutea.AAC.2